MNVSGPDFPPKAIELFDIMRSRRCRCTCDRSDPKRKHPGCPGCALWYECHNELHDLLRCKIWEWPCVVQTWRRPGDEQQEALWRALAAASASMRKARQAQRKVQEASPPPAV